ncbi:MAG: hypothetical protein RLZZ450_1084 [Pseudomonadota bacterium]|jgi:hypothetical protein
MRRWQLCLLVAPLALATGCKKTSRCEDLLPEPNAGSYRGGGSLGEDRLLDVSLEANLKEVVLSYTSRDGSKIRAKYKVTKKTRKP